MSARQAFFNQAAQNWDKKFATPQLCAFLEQFVPLFGLSAGQHILVVGTGTGILIPFLHQAVGAKGRITAIDYAQKMVDICKTKHGHLPNVSVLVANAEKLQFPQAAFDAVVCFGIFPHLNNKNAALNKFRRILKHGGKLIIAHALSSAEVRNHHQSAPKAVASDVLPTETEMQTLLRQAGFTRIEIVDEPGSYLCTSIKS